MKETVVHNSPQRSLSSAASEGDSEGLACPAMGRAVEVAPTSTAQATQRAESFDFLIFEVGGQRYGLPLGDVREVLTAANKTIGEQPALAG